MTGELASDLVIPRDGSTSARQLISAGLRPLLAALPGLPVTAALRAGHAAVLGALRELLGSAPGAVWSVLRRPTVATLIRCKGPLLELDATLAVELALAGVLPGELTVAAPSRVVCLGAGRSFAPGPGALRCRAGEVQRRDAAGRSTPLTGEASHVAITDALALALVDNNPLAAVEAHPDKQGNTLDLGGQPPGRWVEALRAALLLVERHMPALRAEIDVVLQQVVPVGYDASRHLSASYQEAIGTVYLSLHPSPLTMVEALIHEFSHNKLYALLEAGPLLENAFSPLYPSPLRPDPRPLHGVLLAVHAFLPVARLYERMLAAGDAEGLRGRYRQIVAKNHEAAQTLRLHARPTAAGRVLLAEVDRWDRHFMGA